MKILHWLCFQSEQNLIKVLYWKLVSVWASVESVFTSVNHDMVVYQGLIQTYTALSSYRYLANAFESPVNI